MITLFEVYIWCSDTSHVVIFEDYIWCDYNYSVVIVILLGYPYKIGYAAQH